MKKFDAPRNQGITKDSRATVQQVLDPRTLATMSKMMQRGVFQAINGCVSTGKEANVYHATTKVDPHVWLTTRNPHDRPAEDKDATWELAAKIYKTSILVFKDRARYTEGEFRFRHGVHKGNPRKMVAQWAEKEMRNLRRIRAHIPSPEVYELRQNVLVMEFLGKDGVAAPRLKDVRGLETELWQELYLQVARIMRDLTQKCKLIHGDLSEYNMLFHNSQVYLIDVSQSVESDHPHAMDFLKRDCVNVNRFFHGVGCFTVSVMDLFDFVVTTKVGDEEAALDALLDKAEERGYIADSAALSTEEEIFLNTWVPSHLNQISDLGFIEKELQRRKGGEAVLYERLVAGVAGSQDDDDDDDDDEDSEEEASEDSASVSGASEGSAVFDGHRPEDMSKTDWKKLVKEQRREKRKEKLPKKLKKKATKKHR
jgi:RIO kinase 1